jgi:8-oxo-dGTP pyrophosphatase MutT (NUDIX family)
MSKAAPTEIYELKPAGFQPDVEVSACYLKVNDKCLFLKRGLDKSEGGLWGVPGGKIDSGETPLMAALRELREETQIVVDPQNFIYLDALYIKKPLFIYVYHLFYIELDECLPVRLNQESIEYVWVEEGKIAELPLVGGGLEGYQHCMKRRSS